MEEERRKDKLMLLYAIILYVTFNIIWIWLLSRVAFHAYGGNRTLIKEIKAGWIYPILMSCMSKITYTTTLQTLKIKKSKIAFLIKSIGLVLFFGFFLKVCCEQGILHFVFHYGLLGVEPYERYAEAVCTYYLCFNLIVLLYIIPIISAINTYKNPKKVAIRTETMSKKHLWIIIGYAVILAIYLFWNKGMLNNTKESLMYNYFAECTLIYMWTISFGVALWMLGIIMNKKKVNLKNPIIMFFVYAILFSSHIFLAYWIHEKIQWRYFSYSYGWYFALCISGSSIIQAIILSACYAKRIK